jgi:excisionase family DNA binding protein
MTLMDYVPAFTPLWHPRDAAAFLGIHEKTVIKMARLRQLPALRLGKHWRFRATDLVSWADSQVQSTCQPVE